MPVRVDRELILLCEGAADQQLVEKLGQARGIPKFGMLPATDLRGSANFARSLDGIRANPESFSGMRGILIVADSTDNPADAFRMVRKQIASVGGYPVPSAPSVIAPRTADHPAVMATLLPDDLTAGGLETLYVKAVLARQPWAELASMRILDAAKLMSITWPAEKRDKARFAALVAALHRDDPSRAPSWVFRAPKLIDVMDGCFAEFAVSTPATSGSASRR